MTSIDQEPLAPRWHTAALIALICAVAITGTLLMGISPPAAVAPRVTAMYLPMVVVQWSLVLYVSRIGRPRNALSSLLGRRWNSLGRACTDLVLALAGWLLIVAFELAWARFFGANGAAAVRALLPSSCVERIAWIAVSASAGFCEEVVYRGYLQTQLTAFSGRAGLAIVLQAALFGVAHAEQGTGAMVRVTLYGVAFGALARWRRSLLPGIVCHVWTDLASGLLHR